MHKDEPTPAAPAQPVVTDAMIAAGAIAYSGGALKIGLKARLRAAYLAMQAAPPVVMDVVTSGPRISLVCQKCSHKITLEVSASGGGGGRSFVDEAAQPVVDSEVVEVLREIVRTAKDESGGPRTRLMLIKDRAAALLAKLEGKVHKFSMNVETKLVGGYEPRDKLDRKGEGS